MVKNYVGTYIIGPVDQSIKNGPVQKTFERNLYEGRNSNIIQTAATSNAATNSAIATKSNNTRKW